MNDTPTDLVDVLTDVAISSHNEFGGDNFEFKPSTAAERGDIVEETTNEPDPDPISADDAATGDSTDDSIDPANVDAPTGDNENKTEDDNQPTADETGAPETEETAPEVAPAPEEIKPKNKIPLERLNVEIDKRKVLQAKVDELEAKALETTTKPPEETPAVKSELSREDFDSMQNAMFDDKSDLAFEMFQKMMSSQQQPVSEQQLTMEAIRTEIRAELSAESDQKAMQTVAEDMSQSYPELDSRSEQADSGLIEEVIDLRNFHIERGMDPAKALERSVKNIAVENELVNRTVKPQSISDSPRKDVDLEKKAVLANKEKGKLGGDSQPNKVKPLDISSLSDDQFGRLTAEAKARARGDFV